jgi:hypothetical protein
MVTCMARAATSTEALSPSTRQKKRPALRGPFPYGSAAMDQLTLTALQAAATALVE